MSKIFFITGVSSGLGRAFATTALDAGHRVVGTVRNAKDMDAFEALAPERATALLLDVTDDDAVRGVVETVEHQIGPIDVLITNAGYGLEGTVEETSMNDLRRQFDVNVYGTIAAVKAVLPTMRRRRSGHIFTISSMAGQVGLPGVAFYSASKFAVEGFSDSLAQEVAGFGIRVTCLALGGFRTNWAGRSLVRVQRTIADYDTVFDPIRAARRAKDGNQIGDPARAAAALLHLVEHDKPPVHLVLGSDAQIVVEEGRNRVQRDLDGWSPLAATTDFPSPTDDAGR